MNELRRRDDLASHLALQREQVTIAGHEPLGISRFSEFEEDLVVGIATARQVVERFSGDDRLAHG